MKSFREMEVWQKAMILTDCVYDLVATFPQTERYALGDQLRRAAVSIPSNIAEGFGRETHKDFAHFLSVARGSLYEVDTQIEIAMRRGYISDSEGIRERLNEIARMLSALLRHLRVTNAPDDIPHCAPRTKHQALSTIHSPS